MVINGYLLLDFFVSEVRGVLFGFFVCTGTAAYVAFIFYLILHGDCLPSTWFNRLLSKGYAYAG